MLIVYIDHHVEFRNPVSKDEVSKVLEEAGALVFNLEKSAVFRYGISSNKLFDYMAASRPVIFSVQSSNNPVEEAHCGLLVPPRNPEALAEAVISLYRMPREEREAIGRRGREYVETHHDITKLAGRLEHVLSEAVRGG